MSRVNVSIHPLGQDFAPHWDDLVKRARPNVFLSPAALRAVEAKNFAQAHLLLAWQRDAKPEKLAGVWLLQQRNWPKHLATPPYEYCFLSNPVVDPEFMDDVIPAFFDAIERNSALPNVIRFKYLDGDCETYGAIEKALAARNSPVFKLSERERPTVSRTFGQKLSGSTIKKLRQQWNRLLKLGPIEIVNERELDATMTAFEEFVRLEAASWKGNRGTALASNKENLEFAKTLLSSLAERKQASVALMRLGDRAIAAQVLLYCGNLAYTWKIAFDLEFSNCSPGVQLVNKLTEQLLSTGGIEEIEFCAPEGSFLSALWDGHRRSINLLVDLGRRRSLKFMLLTTFERGRSRLKELRNRLRSR